MKKSDVPRTVVGFPLPEIEQFRRPRTGRTVRTTFIAASVAVTLWTLPTIGPLVGSEPKAAAERAPDEVCSDGGMVVSSSAPASRVGAEILRDGGNAVDAAVAVAFALAVTWPEAGNIGGGGFMLVVPPAGEPVTIDYRETAPAAATETMFSAGESTFTGKAAGVPGTVAGLQLAHARFGRRPWKELVEPARRLAAEGFAVDHFLAASINGVLNQEQIQEDARYAELRRVFAPPAGRDWKAGDRLCQPDLATTLARIADQGADGFYRGRTSQLLVDQMQRDGGLITAADLAGYSAKLRPPVRGTYRGYQILGTPPPSSGGIAVIQALQMLEPFELRRADRYSARNLHLIGEVLRRVFRDRALHLGDPDFVSIPVELIDPAYARRLAGEIRLDRATPSQSLAGPIDLADESPETTHFSVVDAQGLAVANTYTLEASWGSRIVVREGGFLLNNEMGDFNWIPGRTDRQGAIGTEPNRIAPGKRMLSSQSPTVVTRDGRVVLITGSPGGRTIISTVLQVVLNVLEFELPPAEAVAAPRQHHQWFPDRLDLERIGDPRYGEAVDTLRAMGHVVEGRTLQGSAHSILIEWPSGRRIGVADPRRGGAAVGVPRG